MLIVFFLMVIILGLLLNKSKFIKILQYICIYIIFVLNSWSEDDLSYRRIYSGYYGSSHEPGFDLLCQVCFKKGIPYETFRIVYVSIAIVLLLIALDKAFKDAGNRAYSLIFLYPLLPLVELLRNFMAIAIVIGGILWYFSRKEEKIIDKIIYIFIIFLGATLHYSVLFFLILLLTNEKKPMKRTYVEIMLLSTASIVICILPIFSMLIRVFFSSEKVLSWFDSANRIGLGVILVLAFHLFSFGIYDYIYRTYFLNTKKNQKIVGDVKKISKKMYSLNVYSFALLGLYTFNMEFFTRLYIVILLLNCFHISVMVRRIRTRNMIIIGFMQIIYHVAMFIYFCRPFSETGIMAMILHNNYLFP